MNEKQVAEKFQSGIDCSQVVLEYFAKDSDISTEGAQKLASFFGGGMGEAETCGAVVGGLMALGLKHGHSESNMEQKETMVQKRAQFFEELKKRHSSSRCAELLGHDISKPEEFQKVLDEGLLFNFCPKLVMDVIEIVEEIEGQ